DNMHEEDDVDKILICLINLHSLYWKSKIISADCLLPQHFSDRHGRDGRDSWGGGYDKRLNPREGGRDWDSGRKVDGDRPWQGRDGGVSSQSHVPRGGMAGRGGFVNTGTSQSLSGALNRQNQLMQGSALQGGAFGRRY
ncbi:scaffold attachment factor B1-like, partial [Nothobranchius furzeri]